ncbi:cobyrinate a,c-diamide synthase [Diaphorobacter caeni]|uniref:cobyrinate a,c-diamide synthase n=1 Tax=Diaphorobacter caeni TaxID=2784387 RepID=UPI00188FF45D|nr:cobyrinate a,c-diamide synthase [Diaphorobacter caeni]MBF5004641.1 cobyrinate a,c-diamide synthase [Diaphorobacter caeni]
MAAPASGQGKTTITAALAHLLHSRGKRVQVFKCGPDFLDPTWLALASGQPVDNIDLAMCGRADVARRLAHATRHNDVVLIEGVMGLFDGARSAADIAALWNLPILLVIDSSSMAETFGAVAFGLAHYRPGLRIAGVLANRVASERHSELLRRSMPADVPWLGQVMRQHKEQAPIPSRHLGLVAADEMDDGLARIAQVAESLAQSDLGRLEWAQWQQRWGVEMSASVELAPTRLLEGRRIAIARDAAFRFIYPANIAFLEEQGAMLRYFSPLAGDELPECDALWLPGGYPELHAEKLGACQPLAESIRQHWHAGKPIWAECGGMLALMQELHWPSKALRTPLLGVIPGVVTQHDRLRGLGMQAWQGPWGMLRGHGFHYSTCETSLPVVGHTQRLLDEDRVDAATQLESVYAQGSLRMSYFHAWFASNPVAAAGLFLP